MKGVLVACILLLAVVKSKPGRKGMDPPKYKPLEAADRAETLVGKSRNEYVCNQVVNYAIYGEKNYKGYLAKDYLNFGTKASNTQPGYVVVAVDGVHVGMVSRDGQHFIHSSSSKWQVIKVDLSQLHIFSLVPAVSHCYTQHIVQAEHAF